MRILITGGFGFIGNNLTKHILQQIPGVKIFIVDNLLNGKRIFLKKESHFFTWKKADINKKIELEKIFKFFKPDIVVHLAAVHYIPDCEKCPKDTFRTNVFGTHNIVCLSNKYKVKHFIFASSACVYKNDGICSEDSQMGANDVYSITKILSEKLIKISCFVPWTILRFFNIFGINETNDHIIETIINQLKHSNEIKLGNIKTFRDYLYVDDLSSAIYFTILNKKSFGSIINLGSGQPFSGKNIIRSIEKIINKRIVIQKDQDRIRKNDRKIVYANITKAKKILKWKPKISLSMGLEEIVKYKNICKTK